MKVRLILLTLCLSLVGCNKEGETVKEEMGSASFISYGEVTGDDSEEQVESEIPLSESLSVRKPASNPCDKAEDEQSCQDLKCEAVFEEGEELRYVACVSPSEKPVALNSKICKPSKSEVSSDLLLVEDKKVEICHQSENGAYHTLRISCNAINAHLDHHNDTSGPCAVIQK